MATQVSRLILAEISETPVKLLSENDLSLQIKRDLIASLEREHCGPAEDSIEPEDPPCKKHKRDDKSVKEHMANLTKQVLWMLENRIAASRVSQTLSSAAVLLSSLLQSSCSSSDPSLEGHLLHRTTLGRHLLMLDGAVDRCNSDLFFQLREDQNLAGVAICTDESPPSQPRFRGMRFQITVMYWGTFKPIGAWETCDDPPIFVRSCLGDIMHCPGKKGVDVSRIIEKQ